MSKLELLAKRGRGRPKDDLESDVYQGVIKGHDVHVDDIEFEWENDVQKERKEKDILKKIKLMDESLPMN